ncbi:ArsR/SmtB family transcription factor [Phaeobacter gallaeciensis]|uniref:ArsR/SmtB family transcription factor n=1 Tax=Phaeobacter gallaeciensis TaxID=60890 RepID=UPI00237F6E1D|nr:helix-turn-helix domain-containing protein [Phaeobacter gallaeciensis]MDE4098498.1 helix-turn-helix domain-containing protein [Phaeobacter gallaeciensis]MDE4107308.1 helix-turn-helix domain-containing protein [Phaeobacter gallaeciensis]MDE4111740.1 helix-turn-helix domain-containing protein [Phaeobacter gallaeciensis]MDE4116233.1 helix-turn-helix domain-containing protein [Phaeobacter gallaeciensis]MDE4120704.1 helix-turn-helix domain-containing protein [Phaeobacter gallaeciensis]
MNRPDPHKPPQTPRFDILGQAIGDASRTRMLCELMEGRAYTNKELAAAAGITPQTATAHLRMLQEAGLVVAEKRGRCVYHRLSGAEVAQALEQLAAIAPADSLYLAQRRKAGGLAEVRSCYDHLAGPLAVAMTQAFLRRGMLAERDGGFDTVPSDLWAPLGVTLPDPQRSARQPFARPCLDWTERRLHVAGPLGRQLLSHALERGWMLRRQHKRGLTLTAPGRRALHQLLGLELSGSATELTNGGPHV